MADRSLRRGYGEYPGSAGGQGWLTEYCAGYFYGILPPIGLPRIVRWSLVLGSTKPLMKSVRLIFVGIACLAIVAGLRAQFVLTPLSNQSAFTGGEQVIGFNSLTNLAAIDTQFIGQDVTFGPGLFASTNSGDTNLFPNNADGVIATNWNGTPALTWTLTFAVAEQQAGFLVEMNSNDVVQLSTSLGGTPHGSVSHTSLNTSPVFFGVQDLARFDTLTFTISGPNNHFFAMDNFRFEPVPEPSGLLLLGLGLPVIAWAGRLGRRGVRRAR